MISQDAAIKGFLLLKSQGFQCNPEEGEFNGRHLTPLDVSLNYEEIVNNRLLSLNTPEPKSVGQRDVRDVTDAVLFKACFDKLAETLGQVFDAQALKEISLETASSLLKKIIEAPFTAKQLIAEITQQACSVDSNDHSQQFTSDPATSFASNDVSVGNPRKFVTFSQKITEETAPEPLEIEAETLPPEHESIFKNFTEKYPLEGQNALQLEDGYLEIVTNNRQRFLPVMKQCLAKKMKKHQVSLSINNLACQIEEEQNFILFQKFYRKEIIKDNKQIWLKMVKVKNSDMDDNSRNDTSLTFALFVEECLEKKTFAKDVIKHFIDQFSEKENKPSASPMRELIALEKTYPSLPNTTSTCFMNSVLQLLLQAAKSSPPLTAALCPERTMVDENSENTDRHPLIENSFISRTQEMFKQLSQRPENDHTEALASFYESFFTTCSNHGFSMLTKGSQNNASEFLQIFLDMMDIRDQAQLTHHRIAQQHISQADKELLLTTKKEQDQPTILWYSLPKSCTSLEDCFKKSDVEWETIVDNRISDSEDKKKAREAGINVRADYTLKRRELNAYENGQASPETLFLAFKVFEHEGSIGMKSKVSAIKLQKLLPVDRCVHVPFTHSQASDETELPVQHILYQIQAIVCHIGDSLTKGHYVTLSFDDDGNVVFCNDKAISKLQIPETWPAFCVSHKLTPYLFALRRLPEK